MAKAPFIWTSHYCLVVFLLLGNLVLAQSTSSLATLASSTAASSLLLQFEQTQQELGQQMMQLQAQGATPAQLNDWIDENQDLIQSQQAIAIQLGAESAALPMPCNSSVVIPDDASQDLADFLTNQANLANAYAQIHNQLLEQGNVSTATESALFQQQNEEDMQGQILLAQKIATAAGQQPLPTPPPLSFPVNASPALKAFLTLHDQLMRAHISIWNQYLTASPVTRDAALQRWLRQNSGLFQQMQQLTQNLSQTTGNGE